jgi:hypothetical protein
MVSTVTAATVTTIATASAAVQDALSFLAIVMLLGMLVVKEIISENPRFQALNRALNVALVPLMLAFLLIAGTKINELL